jgi:hypothetical protein
VCVLFLFSCIIGVSCFMLALPLEPYAPALSCFSYFSVTLGRVLCFLLGLALNHNFADGKHEPLPPALQASSSAYIVKVK